MQTRIWSDALVEIYAEEKHYEGMQEQAPNIVLLCVIRGQTLWLAPRLSRMLVCILNWARGVRDESTIKLVSASLGCK